MKPEDIDQARDAISQRDGEDASYYYDGGFKYLANNEYVAKSLNLFFGWEAMLRECERLRKERDEALNERDQLRAELRNMFGSSVPHPWEHRALGDV